MNLRICPLPPSPIGWGNINFTILPVCATQAEWAVAAWELCSRPTKITAHRGAPRHDASPRATYHWRLTPSNCLAKSLRMRIKRISRKVRWDTVRAPKHFYYSCTLKSKFGWNNLAQDKETSALIRKVFPIHLTFTEHRLHSTNRNWDCNWTQALVTTWFLLFGNSCSSQVWPWSWYIRAVGEVLRPCHCPISVARKGRLGPSSPGVGPSGESLPLFLESQRHCDQQVCQQKHSLSNSFWVYFLCQAWCKKSELWTWLSYVACSRGNIYQVQHTLLKAWCITGT